MKGKMNEGFWEMFTALTLCVCVGGCVYEMHVIISRIRWFERMRIGGGGGGGGGGEERMECRYGMKNFW